MTPDDGRYDVTHVEVVVLDPGTSSDPALTAARAVIAAKLDPKVTDPSTADLLTALAVIVGDAG